MLCPHCGNEISNTASRCPHCGGTIAAGAVWGVRKSSNTYKPQYSSDTEKLTSYVAASPTLHKSKPVGLKIAAGLAAVALVGAMGYAGFTMAQDAAQTSLSSSAAEQAPAALNEEARRHDVILSINAPGLDENGTLVPLKITGADAAGTAFDETVFINADGTGLRLPAGNYGVSPAASPITANGGLFLYNTSNKWFSIDAELEAGETLDATAEVQLEFQPADPSDISTEAIETAKQYAVESGMSEGEVDQLLAATQAAIAEAKAGASFSSVQTYRNITFVGDVRTNTGYIPASGIPETQQILTRTNTFLFTGNTLYFADNAAATDTNSQIALHSRNMSTGQESILATDLASNTTPCYTSGQLIYTAYEWSHSLKCINLSSGEVRNLDEVLPWGFSKLVGVGENSVYVATEDGQLPQLCIQPLGEGEAQIVSLGEAYGNVVGVYEGIVLVAVSGWDSNVLSAYSLEGERLWENNVPDATLLSDHHLYQNGMFCGTSTNGNKLVVANMKSGDIQTFDSNLAYLFGVMAIKDGHVYFAGSNSYASYDSVGTATSTYTTYDLNLENGEIADLGAYEAPQDEELAAQQEQQQQYYYWDNTWTDYSWTDSSTADGATGTWDATGTGTNTWDGTGTWSDAGTGYGTNLNAGDWDANGAWVGNGQGGYDASGNPVY